MEINVEFGPCPFERLTTAKTIHRSTEDILTQQESSETISGRLYFGQHGSDVKHMPFVLKEQETSVDDILSIFLDEWRAPTPKILLFVIAPSKESMSETLRKSQYLLVKGLIAALNTTEMWLCTNALYEGFTKELSMAVQNELSRRRILLDSKPEMSISSFPETALIGICPQDSLNFSHKFEPSLIPITDTTTEKTKGKYTVSKYFDYFIFEKDQSKHFKGIQDFVLAFAKCLKDKLRFERQTENNYGMNSIRAYEMPLLSILFHGEVSDIHLILGLIKNRLPVVIIEGSGGLADILAFAYHQITCRPESSHFAEYTEVVLKPLLCRKINQFYPDISRFNISVRHFCEKIFDCFRHYKQQEQVFLSLLTLRDLEKKYEQLPSHLLRSLFKSKGSEKIKNSFQIKNDLFLAMDWNCPNVASTEIFAMDPTNKFQIDRETFFRALTKPHREEFISIFLNQGFELHKFLDSTTLLHLFQDSLTHNFFRLIIWEGVLGYGATAELSRYFIDSKLVLLLEELTGIPFLINTYELDWHSRRVYDNRTPQEAERKALAVLALWGILSYKADLVKILWKYSEQPVHLALVCSMILRRLLQYVDDLSLKNEIEKQSEEFSIMASNLITACYEKLPPRALDLLCDRNLIWCHKPVLEIAAFAKDRRFIATSCCQKYLDNVFMGNLKVRDLPYGDVTIPLWLKIILTNFLIFPMYLWIDFDTDQDSQTLRNLPLKNRQGIARNKDSRSKQNLSSFKTKSRSLSFWQKLYYLYTAPISIFWVSHAFYLIFLIFFSLAVIWPACGSLYLDFIICFWTAVIIMDSIYHVIKLQNQYTSMPLAFKCAEIILMSVFLLCYVFGRIVRYRYFMSPYHAKVMLCVALLYFHYRIIVIAFPISAALGPMLSRIRRMIFVDFAGFMRVTALIVISNGIVIHATIYPDFPLGGELARRAFYDAMIAFFLTPADHFGNPDHKCIRLSKNPKTHTYFGIPENVCKVGRYYLPQCPNPGIWPYIFGLQYLLFLKLVLLTILIALFSNTEMKMGSLGIYIWKYQRYELVVDFSNRLAFPAPLSPISYFWMLIKYLWGIFHPRAIEKAEDSLLDENDYLYWKNLASSFVMEKKDKGDKKEKTEDRMVKIFALTQALHRQRDSIKDLESMLLKLEIQVKNAHKYLTSNMLEVSLKERILAKNVPQIFSRISPYPFTSISRFPVADNHVTWDRSWNSYDPIAYNMPTEDFPSELRPFVDVDIQMRREIEGEDFQMPVFKWNTSIITPVGLYLNRKSWIKGKFDKEFKYDLDAEGLPMNPFGRTGLRGRGALPRWGPNHYVYVIVTRWHEMEWVSYRNYLEVVLYLLDTDIILPGGFVSTENTYLPIQSLLQCDERWNSEADMIVFFESLSKEEQESVVTPKIAETASDKSLGALDTLKKESLSKLKTRVVKEEDKMTEEELNKPFIYERIRKGYLDEATNTDQAWCEAEVWHFHYKAFNRVEEKFKAVMLWLVLTEDVLGKVPPGQAALLHSVAKKMKAVLEVT
ncbi:transient receptor potential cation channel subfamily M member 2 [Trichonephila inaurata madagascariensis]|uniref:Transient receptor potential cation channel subfamily M member 2 n=1 Tax=Trichonephila inaurata madagascariensis TaxID=2747483 RepID=A0A8X7BWI9_9ARAC|nr:transient receptor potential cation channel subfamily M member 2 [Trichonephila inaurata madagascariensis]